MFICTCWKCSFVDDLFMEKELNLPSENFMWIESILDTLPSQFLGKFKSCKISKKGIDSSHF